jgi:3D (Asp-Asp-Asp) domain-containing protein
LGLELVGANLSRQVSQSFQEKVRVQGSGYLDLGNGADYNGYINYTEATDTFRRTSCPEAANGCARELQTGATSKHLSDRQATKIEIFGDSPAGDRTGTLICIESLNKEILVNDTGGDVGKYQIDVYTGLEGGSVDVGFPGNHYTMVWRLERKA